MTTTKPRIAVRAAETDYRVVRHQDVYLLMPQNEDAEFYLDDWCQDNHRNENGGLIMQSDQLNRWLEFFADCGWVVSYEK